MVIFVTETLHVARKILGSDVLSALNCVVADVVNIAPASRHRATGIVVRAGHGVVSGVEFLSV